MKKLSLLIALLAVCLPASVLHSFDWGDVKRGAEEVLNGHKPLTNDEVIRGLREALSIGSKNSALKAAKENGYFRNSLIFIPFPPEAMKVKQTAEKLGLHKQVDQFVLALNRAAEEAAKEAAPIFLDAIKGMTIRDGFDILNGPNDAATTFLKSKTSKRLEGKYQPIVHNAIQKVQVTKYWKPLASGYNSVPGTKPVNPDLDAYVTERAIGGLFKLVAQEELKIRQDPAARVTDLLRRVFGNQK